MKTHLSAFSTASATLRWFRICFVVFPLHCFSFFSSIHYEWFSMGWCGCSPASNHRLGHVVLCECTVYFPPIFQLFPVPVGTRSSKEFAWKAFCRCIMPGLHVPCSIFPDSPQQHHEEGGGCCLGSVCITVTAVFQLFMSSPQSTLYVEPGCPLGHARSDWGGQRCFHTRPRPYKVISRCFCHSLLVCLPGLLLRLCFLVFHHSLCLTL
ncbi:uncharacterized protein BO97DRAFT_91371 [Aspergillus homomorphus CBS 101889]|uniref:Uncharacterized protein n=1 Tax=Aspergillus homomorphus (strain CBS 101889) TaxID=1450537 RepID=A0A395HUZ2_ASPHC|nr:hypothetical protein BO97DRAFT_91371 [Aspergillus homomorphus CBS 101889]RAL11620.1 hypothetical protein BO97DRAFT_91371 [Aspergillus homomorphus CBS 101889]